MSEVELKIILAEHAKWLTTFDGNWDSEKARNDPRRANFCDADLSGANLSNAKLFAADFIFAKLIGADLNFADLGLANLNGANLSKATLFTAHLPGASLNWANLSETNLEGANLRYTKLGDVDFTNSNLKMAHLKGAYFEPSKLPPIRSISEADGLDELHYIFKKQPLLELRDAFQKAEYHDQERDIIASINASEMWNQFRHSILSYLTIFSNDDKSLRYYSTDILPAIGFAFKYVFFEIPTHWGARPSRALFILVGLIPFFALPYIVVVVAPSQTTGIYRRWSKDQLSRPVRRQTWNRRGGLLIADAQTTERLERNLFRAFLIGIYFSVLSAFRLGWRDLTVGSWIERLQVREYTRRIQKPTATVNV